VLSGQPEQSRRGITLLEVLLVMALLVAIASMALPTLKAPLDNLRLRKAGDIVRTEWARARVKAIEKGRTYTFRYEPSGAHYVVEPWCSGDDYLESSDFLLTGNSALGAPMMNMPAADEQVSPTLEPARTEELPENVVFVASEETEDMRGALLTEQRRTQGAVNDETYSSPVFFYPDGTTSTARLVMANHRGRHIVLTMRGLTGIVKVSDLVSAEQVQ